jgi:AraC-like DNA-binding protein
MAQPPMPLWRVETHGHERHPPGARWWFDNRTRHDGCCVIQLALSGRMRLVAGREYDVGPGQAVLFRQPSPTAYGLPPDARETFVTEWLLLRGAGLAEHWDGIAALRGPVVPLVCDGPVHRAMRQLGDLAAPRSRTPPLVMAAALHAFVMLLWEGAMSAHDSDLRPVERAIEAILAAPTAPWSLKRLADEHGVSREHLARAFRERVGMPPAAWLAAERVRRAVELLERTSLPIRAVRDQTGFASSHTLIRRVRAVTGCSPLAVRRRRQG